MCTCTVCASLDFDFGGRWVRAGQQTDFRGRGYDFHFIGAQRDTVMNGELAAVLDLRPLAKTPHLYGIGPIEQLRGDVRRANQRDRFESRQLSM